MAKGKAGNNIAAFVLELIGSLVFLAVTFGVVNGQFMYGSWSAANLWLPLLYSAAAIGSIGLFILSFANVLGKASTAAYGAMCAAIGTSFALIALTYGSTWFVATLIGFVISFIGAALTYEGKH
jgi:hypothetical protein